MERRQRERGFYFVLSEAILNMNTTNLLLKYFCEYGVIKIEVNEKLTSITP